MKWFLAVFLFVVASWSWAQEVPLTDQAAKQVLQALPPKDNKTTKDIQDIKKALAHLAGSWAKRN